MRNQEFIAKCVRGEIKSGKANGNIFFEVKQRIFGNYGVIYDYGYHYPLLVQVGDKWILNDKGYSVTTSKHIGYAKPYADYSMHMSRETDPRELLKLATDSLYNLQNDLASLSSRAWKQKEVLEARINKIVLTKNFLMQTVRENEGAMIAEVTF